MSKSGKGRTAPPRRSSEAESGSREDALDRKAEDPADDESAESEDSAEARSSGAEVDDEERFDESSAIEPEVEVEDSSEQESDSPAGSTEIAPVGAGALVLADTLQRYLSEIRRIPLLDAEEEHRLAIRWREDGDRAAAARLATSNLRLVVMIARQYQQAFKNLLDLVQEGNLGLLEAVKNFDPYRGVRFPSYAVWWIRAYIIRYVMNNWRLVKLGTTQAQRKLFFNLQREKDRLEREGFRPDPALIAERLAVKPSEVVAMEQRLQSRDLSVDAPMGADGDASMLDFLPARGSGPEASFADAQMRQLVGDKIKEFGQTLRDKEKVIFDQRMIAEDPVTLQEIGEKYGISRERVRQIEERIKRRLRDYLVEQLPDISDVDVRLSLGTSSS